eukprot:scaffold1666_cov424-Prasinococcus_capsulatus_cf.AAC.7
MDTQTVSHSARGKLLTGVKASETSSRASSSIRPVLSSRTGSSMAMLRTVPPGTLLAEDPALFAPNPLGLPKPPFALAPRGCPAGLANSFTYRSNAMRAC